MNLRETRVLAAVQRLGSPTSLEVAEACRYSTTEARAILRDLAERGQIQKQGRRWTVPSVALSVDTDLDPLDIPESDTANGIFACVLVVIMAALLIAITFAIKRLIHG